MPIIKDAAKPQHDMAEFHYGAMPIEGMPTLSGSHNVLYFDEFEQQWYGAELVGAGRTVINWDKANRKLEIYIGDDRVASSATADAIVLKTAEPTFAADAVLSA